MNRDVRPPGQAGPRAALFVQHCAPSRIGTTADTVTRCGPRREMRFCSTSCRSLTRIITMRSGRFSIFVCAMVVLCPVLCAIELTTHEDDHDPCQDALTSAHTHHDDPQSHDQNDPDGNPAPHSEHTCVCTGGAPPGAGIHVPPLEPVAAITADELCLTGLDADSPCYRANARGPTDPMSSSRHTPLLI